MLGLMRVGNLQWKDQKETNMTITDTSKYFNLIGIPGIQREIKIEDYDAHHALLRLSSECARAFAEDSKDGTGLVMDLTGLYKDTIHELLNIIAQMDHELVMANEKLSHPEWNSPDYDPWDS